MLADRFSLVLACTSMVTVHAAVSRLPTWCVSVLTLLQVLPSGLRMVKTPPAGYVLTPMQWTGVVDKSGTPVSFNGTIQVRVSRPEENC